MRSIFIFNTFRWYARLPLKWVVFGLAVLAVCFPYPRLAFRHLQHWRNPNALIEPDSPALQPWIEELRPALAADLPPRETLRRVERFVYERVPYEFDWNTWGLSDYLPTVEEVIDMGREDCDGRAVVAASLLQHFGFKTQIVTNFAHVWVRTDKGETMGPGRRSAVVATDCGLQFQWSALGELPRGWMYGVAVFPLVRQLIVLVVGWWLMLRGNSGIVSSLTALALLCGGLLILRVGSREYLHPIHWMQILGALSIAAAVLLLLLRGRRGKRQEMSDPPESGGLASV